MLLGRTEAVQPRRIAPTVWEGVVKQEQASMTRQVSRLSRVRQSSSTYPYQALEKSRVEFQYKRVFEGMGIKCGTGQGDQWGYHIDRN